MSTRDCALSHGPTQSINIRNWLVRRGSVPRINYAISGLVTCSIKGLRAVLRPIRLRTKQFLLHNQPNKNLKMLPSQSVSVTKSCEKVTFCFRNRNITRLSSLRLRCWQNPQMARTALMRTTAIWSGWRPRTVASTKAAVEASESWSGNLLPIHRQRPKRNGDAARERPGVQRAVS